MNRNEKLEMLQKLDEKTLTKKFLIPLYESPGMKCKNVRYSHRKLEFGKDIIYYEIDKYGNRIYTGVQVKKTKIRTRDNNTIFRQVSEAFGEPFTDINDGKKRELDRFVVLTSNEFIGGAERSLWASLKGVNLNKLVNCIEGKKIVELLDQHLPSAFWDEYDYFCNYFKRMKEDFETIKDVSAIGMKEPIPLEELYVSLRVTERISEQGITTRNGQKIFERELIRRKAEKRVDRALTIDSEKAITDYNKLVILGNPGSGKTTLLKHLALKSCMENLEKQERICVPIPITLQKLSESGKDIVEYIEEGFVKYGFPQAKEFIEKDLKDGKCQLLLDGFDELATKERQHNIINQIHEFIGKFPNNRIIVTSRITGYQGDLKGFIKLELMEFNDDQIKKFIKNWFGETNPDKAKSMLEAIMGNKQIMALARNPLMIAIIAIIYEEDRELPQKRVALYNRCVEVLLSKWDVQKRLKNKYSSEKKEFILRKLAFYGHINNKKILTEKEIYREMHKYFPQIQLKRKDTKPFLEEIWKRSYILRQISIDSYDFLHLSFQEYFTGLELKEQVDGISVIINHLSEPWWEEPILFYAGINRDATTLIDRIRKEVPEDIFFNNLILYGKCIAYAEFTTPGVRGKTFEELWELYRRKEFSNLKRKAIGLFVLNKPQKIIDLLIMDLKKKTKKIRRDAAEALGEIGNEKAVKSLIQALSGDKDIEVRKNAARALGKIGSEKAVKPLIRALSENKDKEVLMNVTFALGEIGNEKAVKPLIRALSENKDINVRLSSAYALGEIGSEKAVKPLIRALSENKDSEIIKRIARVIRKICSENDLESLIHTLNKDNETRKAAMYLFGERGSERAIKPLIQALNRDKNNEVRRGAAYALGRICDEKAVKSLIQAINRDKDSKVRKNAAMALGKISSEKAIKPLIQALNRDKNNEVRRGAAYALGRIGDERAVKPLIQTLDGDKNSETRKVAAFALGEIGGEKVIKPLIKALGKDKNKNERIVIIISLVKIYNIRAIVPLTKVLSKDRDAKTRWFAAWAIGELGNEKSLEPLKKALKDKGRSIIGKVKDMAFLSLEKISKRSMIRIVS